MHSITASFQSCEAKKNCFSFFGTATVELFQKRSCYFGGTTCYFLFPAQPEELDMLRPFFFGHSAGLKIRQGAKMCAWEQTKHAVNYSVQTYQQLPVGRQTHLLQGSWGCETLLLSVPRHLVTLFPSLARELKLYRCPVASGFGRFEITYLTSESHSESYEERFSERLKPLLFYSRISFESPFPHAEVLSNAVQQVSSHRCSFAE